MTSPKPSPSAIRGTPIAAPVTPEALTAAQAFHVHGPFVWRLLRNLGVREADVQDVCQEVFLTLHRRQGELAVRTTLRAWLYGVSVRAAANYRRLACHKREHLVANLPEVACTQADHAGLKLDLLRALESLDDARRAVFILYEVEELSMPEVAEALGCPVTTAYSRLHSARKSIQAAFRQAAVVHSQTAEVENP